MGLVFDDKVDAAVGTIFYLKVNMRITIDTCKIILKQDEIFWAPSVLRSKLRMLRERDRGMKI